MSDWAYIFYILVIVIYYSNQFQNSTKLKLKLKLLVNLNPFQWFQISVLIISFQNKNFNQLPFQIQVSLKNINYTVFLVLNRPLKRYNTQSFSCFLAHQLRIFNNNFLESYSITSLIYYIFHFIERSHPYSSVFYILLFI